MFSLAFNIALADVTNPRALMAVFPRSYTRLAWCTPAVRNSALSSLDIRMLSPSLAYTRSKAAVWPESVMEPVSLASASMNENMLAATAVTTSAGTSTFPVASVCTRSCNQLLNAWLPLTEFSMDFLMVSAWVSKKPLKSCMDFEVSNSLLRGWSKSHEPKFNPNRSGLRASRLPLCVFTTKLSLNLVTFSPDISVTLFTRLVAQCSSLGSGR